MHRCSLPDLRDLHLSLASGVVELVCIGYFLLSKAIYV